MMVDVRERVPRQEAIDPHGHGERIVVSLDQALIGAVQIASPERVGEDPRDVFDPPYQPRNLAPDPGWSKETEASLRNLMGMEFGYGRASDLLVSELLPNQEVHVNFDPGLMWKMYAEAEVVLKDPDANVASYVFMGSDKRITSTTGEEGRNELLFSQQKLGSEPKTEYEGARTIAENAELISGDPNKKFIPLEGGDQVVAFSYDIDNGFAVGQEPTGQLKLIGHIEGKPVYLFRVDREDYFDEVKQEDKYRNQPDPEAMMTIMSEFYRLNGDIRTPMANVTSSTYQTSRQVQMAIAGLRESRIMVVSTYGMDTLARVNKGVPPAARNQMPGEINTIAKNVDKLRDALRTPFEKRFSLRHEADPRRYQERMEAIVGALLHLALAGTNPQQVHDILNPFRSSKDRIQIAG